MHLQAAGPIALLKEELRTGLQALWLTLKCSRVFQIALKFPNTSSRSIVENAAGPPFPRFPNPMRPYATHTQEPPLERR
jgi:hypothetical protein